MKYLLDTNICIYIIKKKPVSVLGHFKHKKAGSIFISSISLYELFYGAYKSQFTAQSHQAVQQFMEPLEPLEFDDKASDIAGQLRAELERKGQMIGQLDLLIAAQALSRNLIVVTNNTKEFRRIKNLSVENWV